MNLVILQGNLGADPELRYTGDGTPVANLRLATNQTWTDRDGNRQQETTWHSLVAWDKMAETIAEYFEKGDQILVRGRIQTNEWEDRDGNDRRTQEIRILNFEFTGQGPSGDEQPQTEEDDFEEDDDLPF